MVKQLQGPFNSYIHDKALYIEAALAEFSSDISINMGSHLPSISYNECISKLPAY